MLGFVSTPRVPAHDPDQSGRILQWGTDHRSVALPVESQSAPPIMAAIASPTRSLACFTGARRQMSISVRSPNLGVTE